MTRPSALVLDGNVIKLRLMAERTASRTAVHVDWLRFTVQRRNTPAPSVDKLFPLAGNCADTWDRVREVSAHLAQMPDCETDAYAQAAELGQEVTALLGEDFTLNPEICKGHDFYRHRLSIERAGQEVGWIGYGASSDSPRQSAQAKTLHANLYGVACTFASHGWSDRIANLIDERKAVLTRADLALDFFDGISGGILRIGGLDGEYDKGYMDVNGRRPVCKHLGDWSHHSKGGRSFYFGSKEAGKQTNVYEKGDQLYGVEAGSKWLRVELRYGNKLRVLPTDMLRRPADFFAGASQWHAAMLAEAESVVAPEPVLTVGRLPLETVKAEAYRCARWCIRVAGPALAALIRYAPQANLNELASITQRPGRLKNFTESELQQAFADLFSNSREGVGSALALT